MRWKADREVTFEPVHLREFDLEVSWAMCRNPMCQNFGVFFRGCIPKGGTSTSDDNYIVRIKLVDTKDKKKETIEQRLVGAIECRCCGHTSRLASNRAIRPIARYYLSLSLPYADCPNPKCPNYGINLFEHWADAGPGKKRPYRLHSGKHQVCCRYCGSAHNRAERRKSHIPGVREPFSPYINIGEVMRPHGMNHETRKMWGKIIEGVRTGRTVTDSYEILDGLTISTYYRHLSQISSRLRDYHSARNARLLHPDFAKRKEPIKLYTDVLDVSLQAWERDRRHVLLKYIVTSVPAGGTIFVLAAHPFFLPQALCPDDKARDRDDPLRRVDFEREWDCVLHEGIAREPGASSRKTKEDFPEIGRGGYFIRSPYAEVAHFLTVQKMLSRFQTIHCYTDAAKELYTGALVAMRARILAGNPGAERPADGRRRALPTTEIVLFQHKKKERVRRRPELRVEKYEDITFTERREKRNTALRKAWRAAEQRIRSINNRGALIKIRWAGLTPSQQASVYRKAFKGGYSKYGGWAWLRFPPDSAMYRTPRTLWLTRMPGKTFAKHGEAVLMDAWLQPVDSTLNAIRARVNAAHRPATRAIGRGFAERYVLPATVQNELLIYLVGRNYSLRRKTRQKFVPASKMGLMKLDLKAELLDLMVRGDTQTAMAMVKENSESTLPDMVLRGDKKGAAALLREHPERESDEDKKKFIEARLAAANALMRRNPDAAIEALRKAPDAPRLDYLKHAWEFRLGITEAKRISRWLST